MEQLDICGHSRMQSSHPYAREMNSPLAEHRAAVCQPGLGFAIPQWQSEHNGKYSLIAHPIALVGLNEDLCATGIGILSYFRAWLLVHRIHVQECVSVHGFVGLLPTTPPSLKEHHMEPSELAHRSQPQEL